jgi:hypothetical protein
VVFSELLGRLSAPVFVESPAFMTGDRTLLDNKQVIWLEVQLGNGVIALQRQAITFHRN